MFVRLVEPSYGIRIVTDGLPYSSIGIQMSVSPGNFFASPSHYFQNSSYTTTEWTTYTEQLDLEPWFIIIYAVRQPYRPFNVKIQFLWPEDEVLLSLCEELTY
jgi:hypothetical protein